MTRSDLKLYADLAKWWPLISPPSDYAEGAALDIRLLQSREPRPTTLLELGSGGGNNASHLKAHFTITLVDRSPAMLAVSRSLNPECEHLEGDMRDVRLDRQFDVVLIHDAISHMTTQEDLRAAMETAFVHCRGGGCALFQPDWVAETFRPGTFHGGHDGSPGDSGEAAPGIRYLEWWWDPDPADTTYITQFAFLIRESTGVVRIEHDVHELGLYPRGVWMEILRHVGFEPSIHHHHHSRFAPQGLEVFLGRRPAPE